MKAISLISDSSQIKTEYPGRKNVLLLFRNIIERVEQTLENVLDRVARDRVAWNDIRFY